MTRKAGLAALACAFACAIPAQALAAPPVNDDVGKAFEIRPFQFGVFGDTTEATREMTEPAHAGDSATGSVWFRYRAPQTGAVVVDTCAAGGDTVIAVYRGTALPLLTLESEDDDGCGQPDGGASVRFKATAGDDYAIAVAGEEGPFALTLLANDEFAAPLELVEQPVSRFTETRGATKEPNEDDHAGEVGGHSVWFTLTPSRSGNVAVHTCGLLGATNFDTLLGVYTGNAVDGLTEVGSDDDTAGCGDGTQSLVRFPATAGVTYRIAVDGKGGDSGQVELAAVLNDDFPAARPISGDTSTQQASNLGATKQTGEPDHDGDGGGSSVWFELTPSRSGRLQLDTCDNPLFATLLDVYTGTEVDALTRVVPTEAPAACAGGHGRRLAFMATAGTPYRIAVDGAGAAGGYFILGVTAPPPNDNLADAEFVGAGPSQRLGHNLEATVENREPDHAGDDGGKSVWYSFHSVSKRDVTVDTCSVATNFDTLLAVYEGPPDFGGLVPVPNGSSDDDPGCGPGHSRVTFQAAAGVEYWIAVDGKGGASGNFLLTFDLPLANDDLADAEQLPPVAGTRVATSAGATEEAGEPDHAGDPGGASVWYSLTLPAAAQVTIDTCGGATQFDTVLAVYTGSSYPLAPVTDSNARPPCGMGRRVEFAASAGVTYRIAVDGKSGASGPFELSVSVPPLVVPPPHDDFADAQILRGAPAVTNGDTTDATAEPPQEPAHAGQPASRSVWFRFTAAAAGPVEIDTCQAGFDSRLAVYTGPTLDALTEIASNDDAAGCGTGSRVQIAVTSGLTYHVAVDANGAGGPFTLNLSAPPANDHFADAIVLGPGTAFSLVDTRSATAEPLEPHHGLGADGPGKSAWYRFTSPADRTVTLDSCGVEPDFPLSQFDSVIVVYQGPALDQLQPVGAALGCPGGKGERVRFSAVAGKEYRIAVTGSMGAGGQIIISLTANDDLDEALDLPPATTRTAGFNGTATKESGEGDHAGQAGGRSLWYRFSPPAGGEVTFDTCGTASSASPLDTLLAVYPDTVYPLPPAVAASDDVPGCGRSGAGSRVTLPVSAGDTYLVAIDGKHGAVAPFELGVTFTPAVAPPGGGGDGGPVAGAAVIPGAGPAVAQLAGVVASVFRGMRVRTGSSVTASAGGSLEIPVRNDNPVFVAGTVVMDSPAFRARSSARRVEVGRRSFRVGPGRTVRVKLRLTRTARKQLARARKLKVRVTVTVSGPGGARKTTRRNVTIKAPKALRRPRR